ncbi:unnamed protein product [Arctogadus glacialis]
MDIVFVAEMFEKFANVRREVQDVMVSMASNLMLAEDRGAVVGPSATPRLHAVVSAAEDRSQPGGQRAGLLIDVTQHRLEGTRCGRRWWSGMASAAPARAYGRGSTPCRSTRPPHGFCLHLRAMLG